MVISTANQDEAWGCDQERLPEKTCSVEFYKMGHGGGSGRLDGQRLALLAFRRFHFPLISQFDWFRRCGNTVCCSRGWAVDEWKSTR